MSGLGVRPCKDGSISTGGEGREGILGRRDSMIRAKDRAQIICRKILEDRLKRLGQIMRV